MRCIDMREKKILISAESDVGESYQPPHGRVQIAPVRHGIASPRQARQSRTVGGTVRSSTLRLITRSVLGARLAELCSASASASGRWWLASFCNSCR